MVKAKNYHSDDSAFILLSIGTNLGDRKEQLNSAVNRLKSSEMISDVRVSSFYETEPVGYQGQPWFLNIAASCRSRLSLKHFFDFCKTIEADMGRVHRELWHEREIDIDILLYDELTITTPQITIPHPRMHERKFVLVPAAEIAGDVICPGFGISINEMLNNCKDSSVVLKIE